MIPHKHYKQSKSASPMGMPLPSQRPPRTSSTTCSMMEIKRCHYIDNDNNNAKPLEAGKNSKNIVHKHFELEEPRECAALPSNSDMLQIDEGLASKVVAARMSGEFGLFTNLTLPTGYEDCEGLRAQRSLPFGSRWKTGGILDYC